MTSETIVREDVEQTTSTSLDVALDSNLAAAQFEAIICAWKGEVVDSDVAIPMSPIGDADLDGSLFLGPLDPGNLPKLCGTYLSWVLDTWTCTCTCVSFHTCTEAPCCIPYTADPADPNCYYV